MLLLLEPSVHRLNHFSSIVHQRLAVIKNLAEIKNVTKKIGSETNGVLRRSRPLAESSSKEKRIGAFLTFFHIVAKIIDYFLSSSNNILPTPNDEDFRFKC